MSDLIQHINQVKVRNNLNNLESIATQMENSVAVSLKELELQIRNVWRGQASGVYQDKIDEVCVSMEVLSRQLRRESETCENYCNSVTKK